MLTSDLRNSKFIRLSPLYLVALFCIGCDVNAESLSETDDVNFSWSVESELFKTVVVDGREYREDAIECIFDVYDSLLTTGGFSISQASENYKSRLSVFSTLSTPAYPPLSVYREGSEFIEMIESLSESDKVASDYIVSIFNCDETYEILKEAKIISKRADVRAITLHDYVFFDN